MIISIVTLYYFHVVDETYKVTTGMMFKLQQLLKEVCLNTKRILLTFLS